MDWLAESEAWTIVPEETLCIEKLLTKHYSHQQKEIKNLTFNQIVGVVQKQLEDSRDTAILTLKGKAHQRDSHAVKSLKKIISDSITDLGISSAQGQHEDIVLYVFSELYGFKNVELEKVYDSAKSKQIVEIYVNRRNDVRYIDVYNERGKLDGVYWENDQDVEDVLKRLTIHHPDGQAGKNNAAGRLQLADGTRLSYTAGDTSRSSFNMRFDRSVQLFKENFVPKVMTEDVYKVLIALTVSKSAYGIIGQGAIGKTALLRQLLFELVTLYPRIRLFIMELMAELNLERFLIEKGLDPDIVECVATQDHTLEDLFENMKQRAAELIVQGEILSSTEVSNLLTGYKAGHAMGPFTGHSTGRELPRYLAELMAQEKHVNLEATTQQVMHVLDASVVLKEKIDGASRKLVEIWQYPGESKLLIKYDIPSHSYKFYPAQGELREKLETLAFDVKTKFLYEHLIKLSIL